VSNHFAILNGVKHGVQSWAQLCC